MKSVLTQYDSITIPLKGDIISFDQSTNACNMFRDGKPLGMIMGYDGEGRGDKVVGLILDGGLPAFWQALSLVSIFNKDVKFQLLPRISQLIEVRVEAI